MVLRDLLGMAGSPSSDRDAFRDDHGRPQDAPVNQLINRIGTVDTDQAMARRAGQLRFGVERPVPVGRRPASTPSSPPMPPTRMRRRLHL